MGSAITMPGGVASTFSSLHAMIIASIVSDIVSMKPSLFFMMM
jgi:hypothetical protein